MFKVRLDIDDRVGNEAIPIDKSAKKVRVRRPDNGLEYDEPYDIFILSPSARLLVLNMPSTDDPRVMTMRAMEDTLAMRDFVAERKPSKAVVVGNRYIGLEVAENLAGMDVKVTLVQRPNHVFSLLDRDMAVDVHHRIGPNGVEFLLSEAVTGFETDGNLEVNLCSERVLEANIAVVVLGVVFEIRLAFEANLRTGVRGAIITNIHTRTSDPSI